VALRILSVKRKYKSLMVLIKQRSSLGFPFHTPSQGDACAGVRGGKRRVRRSLDQHRARPTRVLLYLASLVGWPLYLAGTLREGMEVYAERIPVLKGEARASRHHIFSVYWYCLCHQLTVPEYFLYRLDDPKHPFNVDDYLFSFECRLLVGSLNSRECNRLIDDKLAFQHFLSSHALPVAKTFVVSSELCIEDTTLKQKLSGLSDHLWVKPRRGSCGVSAEEWRVKDGRYRSSDGCLLTSIQLLEHLRAKAEREQEDQLVQEYLNNHPGLEVLSNGALCVLRIITISSNVGLPLVALAYLDLPCGGATKSNRGMIAEVEIEEGRLLDAWLHRDMDISVASHPDTGHLIRGFHLPNWEECKSLVQQSHQSIEGAVCLAWDVALTTGGTVILEANAYWVADEFQRIMQCPVGRTAFGGALLRVV